MYKKHFATFSENYLYNIHLNFTNYANTINADNDYKRIDVNVLNFCLDDKDKIFIYRDDLLENVKRFKNAFEKAFVIGLFEGLLINDFDDLTMDCIDNNGMLHIPNKRNLKMSNQFIEYARQAADCYEVMQYSDRAVVSADRNTVLDPYDVRIIKDLANTNGDRTFRYRRIIQKTKKYYEGQPEWLAISQLRQSGSINMLLEFASKESEKSMEDVAEEHIEEIRYRYGVGWRFSDYRRKYDWLLEK